MSLLSANVLSFVNIRKDLFIVLFSVYQIVYQIINNSQIICCFYS